MTRELKPVRTKTDYKAALGEPLWGAKNSTPRGDRLEVLAALIDAYEAEHFPINPPDRRDQVSYRTTRLTRSGEP